MKTTVALALGWHEWWWSLRRTPNTLAAVSDLLPSLARADAAGAFGRYVLLNVWSGGGRSVRYAKGPRERRWFRRMQHAGIVERLEGRKPVWCLATQWRSALDQEIGDES